MAEALWALGSASALRAWVGLSRPEASLDGVNKGIKLFIGGKGGKSSTSQQASPPDQQLEVELIRRQVGCWAGEDGMGTLLLRGQGPLLFPHGGTEAAGGSEENDTQCSVFTSLRDDAAEFRTHPFSSDLPLFSVLLEVIWPVTMGVRSVG